MTQKKSNITAYFLLLFVAIVWGGTWPLGRWMVTANDTIPPFMIAVIRYVFVIITFFIILILKEKSIQFNIVKNHWKLMTFMGLISVTIYQAGYLFGEKYTSASDASLVIATGPIWVLMVAPFLVNEKFTTQKILGSIIGFIGVLIIVGFSPNTDVENRLLGNFFILIGAIAYGIYTVLIRYYFNQFEEIDKPSSLFLITWVSFLGFLTMIPVGIGLSPEYFSSFALYFQISINIWYGIFYLTFISTILAYLAYTEGISRLQEPSQGAIFILFVPVFGIALSAIFLNEIIDPVIHFISFLCIVIGVTLVNRSTSSKHLVINEAPDLTIN